MERNIMKAKVEAIDKINRKIARLQSAVDAIGKTHGLEVHEIVYVVRYKAGNSFSREEIDRTDFESETLVQFMKYEMEKAIEAYKAEVSKLENDAAYLPERCELPGDLSRV